MLRPNAIIKGQPARYQQYHLQYSPGLDMEHKIREFETQMGIPAGGGIPIKYARRGETFGSLFSALIVITLLGLIFRAVSKNVKSMGSINPLESMTKAPFTLINPKLKKNQGTKFSDVAGLKEAKTEVKEFVDYLKNPQKYKELGAKPPKVTKSKFKYFCIFSREIKGENSQVIRNRHIFTIFFSQIILAIFLAKTMLKTA